MSQAAMKLVGSLAELAKAVGLNELEWEHLKTQLGREPSETELQMIGVMWSEHCSYKSSKRYLKKLNTSGPQVLQGPGENAGLIHFDEKRALAFKVESHNHPSFVEPFQGAATGVGGILRDIFTMGARPIACGDYLRFGDLKSTRQQFLLDGVVSGIAHYGNCIGIPTVAGELRSDPSYNGNILVNVFALGIVDKAKVFKAATAKPGALVMIWGAKTGRDGIHGASLLASADFSQTNTSDGQKVRVQVGDPFKEKCLMEATLEAMDQLREHLWAIQDMGAAGLTCSTMEIAYKSNIGMEVDLDKVPMRETGMKAFELLLSESQERMLAVVEPGSEGKFQKLLEKWGCDCAVIGKTVDGDRLLMRFNGDEIVDLPVQKVMDPPDANLPEPIWTEVTLPALELSKSASEWNDLKTLLAVPSVASKREIYQRYDSTVGDATVLGPGHEAAVLWVGGDAQDFSGIGFKGICNEQWAGIDPKRGIEMSFVQSVRGLACVGAKALAYTDGVNLGNPYEPKTLGALSQTVEGLNNCAEVFSTPCISGNVSLYNQTSLDGQKVNILPTIFAVVVGKIEDVRKVRPSVFQEVGSEVWMLEAYSRPTEEAPMGSLYARLKGFAGLPPMDLSAEKSLQEFLLEAHKREIFLSLRSVGEGGLAVAIAKACFGVDPDHSALGFEGDFLKFQQRRDSLLFGEAGGRVIVEVSSQKRSELMNLSMSLKLPIKRLGTVVEGDRFEMKPLMSGKVSELMQTWLGVFK